MRIYGTHWILFVMFVKPAGNAYGVKDGGGGEGGFVRRKCSSDHRESWTAESQTRISHALMYPHCSPMRDLCDCVFRRGGEEGEHQFGLIPFLSCFPYKPTPSTRILFNSEPPKSCRVLDWQTELLFWALHYFFRELFLTQTFIGQSKIAENGCRGSLLSNGYC